MGKLSNLFRPFRSFDRKLAGELADEARRIAANPDPDARPGPTDLTNIEVVTESGGLSKVRRIVAAAETTVAKAEVRFNGHRDAADEARRAHQALAGRRRPVPTRGGKHAHREDATMVGGDAVVAGRAGETADRLRDQADADTEAGSPDHLTGLSPHLLRIGLVVLVIDTASLLFFFFRWLNVALTAAAFRRDPAGQIARVVTALGFASIISLLMFMCARQAGRLTWASRNAPRDQRSDPGRKSKLRWLRIKAGLLWATIITVSPVTGFGVGQRLLHEGEGAGNDAAGTALAVGLGLVFTFAPLAIALSESFAASRIMQRVSALGSIAADLHNSEEQLAKRVVAQDQAADQAERHARNVVATARREADHARLAADQLIWGNRGRRGHLGEIAAAVRPVQPGPGELLPDIRFDAAFAPLEEMLQRMAARRAGPVPTLTVSEGAGPADGRGLDAVLAGAASAGTDPGESPAESAADPAAVVDPGRPNAGPAVHLAHLDPPADDRAA